MLHESNDRALIDVTDWDGDGRVDHPAGPGQHLLYRNVGHGERAEVPARSGDSAPVHSLSASVRRRLERRRRRGSVDIEFLRLCISWSVPTWRRATPRQAWWAWSGKSRRGAGRLPGNELVPFPVSDFRPGRGASDSLPPTPCRWGGNWQLETSFQARQAPHRPRVGGSNDCRAMTHSVIASTDAGSAGSKNDAAVSCLAANRCPADAGSAEAELRYRYGTSRTGVQDRGVISCDNVVSAPRRFS